MKRANSIVDCLRVVVLLVIVPLVFVMSCSKEMNDQPKFEIFEGNPQAAPAGTVSIEDIGDPAWPEKPTLEILKRGRERYEINCSQCHGYAGNGDGMVVQRGFSAPQSFYSAKVTALSREEIASIIKLGLGRMAAHQNKVLPVDRQAIAMYVKALQLSRAFPKAKLSARDLSEIQRASK